MPSIYCLPDEKRITAYSDETLLDAALRSGIPHAHACGGSARCSTCRVVVLEGLEHCSRVSPKEKAIAERLGFGPEIRLACQTYCSGDVTIRRPVLDEVDQAVADLTGEWGMGGPVGEEADIAVLFSDINGYTAFCEGLLPYDVISALNRYYFLMEQVIERNAGSVSDYMGDGIMALFGLERPATAAIDAVRAGMDMLAAVERLDDYLVDMYGKRFRIRLGVHYGTAVVGSIGTARYRKVTAIGDVVNIASRIEEESRQVRSCYLISDSVYAQVSDEVVAVPIGERSLRGSGGEHTLYEVHGVEQDEGADRA